eukprot:17746_6
MKHCPRAEHTEASSAFTNAWPPLLQKARPSIWPVAAQRTTAMTAPERLVSMLSNIDSFALGFPSEFFLSGLISIVVFLTRSSPPVSPSRKREKAIKARPYVESDPPPCPFFTGAPKLNIS